MRLPDSIRQTIRFWRAFELDSSIPELAPYAELAYLLCVGWFDPPLDPEREYQIIYGPQGACAYDRIVRAYLIMIPRHYRDQEQRYATLGHEMYHRVTIKRNRVHKGLARLLWIDEMLAYLTAQQILRELGFEVYAEKRAHDHYASAKWRPVMSIDKLQRVRSRRVVWWLAGTLYPDGFAAGVAIAGMTMQSLVGWEQMCRLVHCRTWEEWLAPMPAPMQRLIRPVLEPCLA